jgi:hypothetical protein
MTLSTATRYLNPDDKDLLEKVANICDFQVVGSTYKSNVVDGCEINYAFIGLQVVKPDHTDVNMWSPLISYSDAFDLAVRLNIMFSGTLKVIYYEQLKVGFSPSEAYCRAITMTAACVTISGVKLS